MPGFQRARIWEEKELSDEIKASILSEPDETIITSSTSNFMMEPCCLVLLDHAYPVIGLTSVSVKRSRSNQANTASFTMQNIKTRYSGTNRAKVAPNTPVSIYMGYGKKYLQRFEGYIDTTSMSVSGTSSTVTVECRDRAKDLIEQEISAGIYSGESEYYGEGYWHYQLGQDRTGQTTHEPRPWKRSEVLRDICYVLGLRDIVPSIWIEEVYNSVTGFTTYVRHVTYGPEFHFDIDSTWDTEITCNFVEENALDVLSKLAQSIFHEAFFDQRGHLIVRPVRTAADPTDFYFKEERDIESLQHKVNDDNVVNSIVITGQTAGETSVVYPFAPVAVEESIEIEKGQDEYGHTTTYPRVVAQENLGTLQHPALYAYTISPDSEPVDKDHPEQNPENKPNYDMRLHYPSFNQPYEKQLCLEASCPMITDEALKANQTNVRTWNFYGELDTAVAYEKQPIMLEDRFGTPILVVCKERSMDDYRIEFLPDGTPTGIKPFKPDDITTPNAGEEPANIPTVFKHHKYTVDSSGTYTYLDEDNIPMGTVHYDSVPGVSAPAYSLAGWDQVATLPTSAMGQIPRGLTVADFNNKGFTLTQFTATKGVSPYASIANEVFDMASMVTILEYGAICKCVQDVDIYAYTVGTPPAVTTYYAPMATIGASNYNTITVEPATLTPNTIYNNCAPSTGTAGLIVLSAPSPYIDYSLLPSGAVIGAKVATVQIEYPMIFIFIDPGIVGVTPTVALSTPTNDIIDALQAVQASQGKYIEVYTATVDARYVSSSDPDTNCIYWRWMGHFKKPTTDAGPANNYGRTPYNQDPNQGQDANNKERVQITREEFYKLAADPHTVVIECVTAGVDYHSWSEVIELTEYKIVCKGHNLYGSMHDAYEEMLKKIQEMMNIITALFTLLSLTTAILGDAMNMGVTTNTGGGIVNGGGTGAGASHAADAQTAIAVGVIINFLGAMMTFVAAGNLEMDLGANVSKVMEDLSVRLTGIRRPEIEMYEPASSQAGQWWLTDAEGKHKPYTTSANPYPATYNCGMESMGMEVFEHTETSSLNAIYNQDVQKNYSYTGMTRDVSWVFIMDLTRNGPGFGGVAAPTMFPMGAMVTAIGWETPEVGDRNPIPYYSGVDYEGNTYLNGMRREIKARFAFEAFGDDPYDEQYTAETLLRLRFERHNFWGLGELHPGTNEIWYNSKGYEVLVDRSMTQVGISDTGQWFDFFEKRDDFRDRRYKYLALVVYEWEVSDYQINSSSGYTYKVITTPMTWAAARAYCQNVLGGDLASITSAAENATIFSLLPPGQKFWVGGKKVSGVWTWCDGEPFSYTQWATGEPNNSGSVEDSMQIYGTTGLEPSNWNDEPGSFTMGFVCKIPQTPGSQNMVGNVPIDPNIVFDKHRWGIYVPRGLNKGWYGKFRWFEKTHNISGAVGLEQNYLFADVILAGQERLILNLLNNFKYSSVVADLRIWGKAFGTFAPTLVYYKETNQLSVGTYGERQIELSNDCINDFETARKLATMLTAQSNETYNITTTGKPYLYEGALVMVKEENSGAIAGVFRNWENTWKYPDQKTTVQPSNQLMTINLPGVYYPQCATPTYGNCTLVACGTDSPAGFPIYLLELDKVCNAKWYMLGTSNERPTFILRWEGVGGQYDANAWTYTIVGIATGDVLKFDYNVSRQVDRYVLPGQTPLCGTMDEEQATMFIGTATSIHCVDLASFSVKFINTDSGARGIASAIWSTYDDDERDYKYDDYGVLFFVGTGGITCRKMYSDADRTDLGPVLATLTPGTFGIPFDNPGSLEFSKELGELVYVNKATATTAASIWGIGVEVSFDPAFPETGMTVEFTDVKWVIDYMEDADLKAALPSASARLAYINKFFQPNHAIHDINKDLLISDPANNRVYRLNPSGKFYVTSVTDSFSISDTAASYKQDYELVTVSAAGSLQLTNFGKNFLQTKTEEQIEAAASTATARIIQELKRDKFVVKLLTSDTMMEAINNSGQTLKVMDTVLVVLGYNGDTSGVGTIIAKKALNDWNIETGDPYTYKDATSIDVTKYGESATDTSGNSNTDLSYYNARIRKIENQIRTLAGLHGITL